MTETPAQTTSSPTQDFEPRRPVGSFLSVTREVLLSPARFFSGIRRGGSRRGPVLYAVICSALLVPLAGSYDLLLAALRGNLSGLSALGVAGPWGGILAGLLLFVFSPLAALVGLYIGSAISQVFVRIVVGRDNAGYDATLRATAYASAVALLTWLPLGLVAGLWGVWVSTNGLKELHETTTARALIVAAVPYLVTTALLVGPVVTGEISPVELLFGGGLTGGLGAGR